jgi:hypothetical protein
MYVGHSKVFQKFVEMSFKIVNFSPHYLCTEFSHRRQSFFYKLKKRKLYQKLKTQKSCESSTGIPSSAGIPFTNKPKVFHW